MEAMPSVCPTCGDQMSTPLLGRQSRRLISTCRNPKCATTIHSSTPFTRAEDFPPRPHTPAHGQMFIPSTAAPAPPRPRDGAMARFDRAATGGSVRKAIQGARRHADAANAQDGKWRAIGGDR